MGGDLGRDCMGGRKKIEVGDGNIRETRYRNMQIFHKHKNSKLRSASEESVIVLYFRQMIKWVLKKSSGNLGWKWKFFSKIGRFRKFDSKISGYGSEMIFGPLPKPKDKSTPMHVGLHVCRSAIAFACH